MYAMELRDIYAACRRIRGLVRETPLEPSPFLSDMCFGEVWLKLENQQITGSFKARGALNKLLQLSAEERSRGIVAASSGNHAQGVGYAAGMLGVEATIVVPSNTPEVKLEAIRRYGVKLVVHGEEYMDAERLARRMEREECRPFVSGYNDLDIIAGQGTVGLEVLGAMPDLDAILVPVGGGGLISGVGCAVKNIDRDIEVIGVQSVASPVMCESVRRGRIVDIELEDFVREETIIKAIGLLLTRQHQIVEGAGAVGVAAMMEDPERFADRKVGVVISGGNIETELIKKALNTL